MSQFKFSGKKGIYYGNLKDSLPNSESKQVKDLDRKLKKLGFHLVGKLTFSFIKDIESYIYISEDHCVAASINKKVGFFGSDLKLSPKLGSTVLNIDFTSCLSNGIFLITTTHMRQKEKFDREKKLFFYFYPRINESLAFQKHIEHTKNMSEIYGFVQAKFIGLHSVTSTIDECLHRQKSILLDGKYFRKIVKLQLFSVIILGFSILFFNYFINIFPIPNQKLFLYGQYHSIAAPRVYVFVVVKKDPLNGIRNETYYHPLGEWEFIQFKDNKELERTLPTGFSYLALALCPILGFFMIFLSKNQVSGMFFQQGIMLFLSGFVTIPIKWVFDLFYYLLPSLLFYLLREI